MSKVRFEMGQAKFKNHTACEYQVLFLNDEEFRPLMTVVIKATFIISNDGRARFAKQQLPINLDGEYVRDPESSSYIYEPETAFTKLSTDVVVIGDAISQKKPTTHLPVDIRVGDMHKKLLVVGDRFWRKQAVGYTMSDAKPFEKMPLIYENAFGGWDLRYDDPQKQGFCAQNTVGKGYYRTDVAHIDLPMPLPNIEDSEFLITTIDDRPPPAGCGFTLPHWHPRARLAGTYDDHWRSRRNPLLPEDFDRRFFNAASEGLVSTDYLIGDEPVTIKNMTANGMLEFALPGARPPVCRVEFPDTEEILKTVLDTVIINVRTLQLQLIWRGYMPLATGPHDVEAIDIVYG